MDTGTFKAQRDAVSGTQPRRLTAALDRLAVEAARCKAPSFASYRNLQAASAAELARRAVEDPHQTFVRPTIVATSGKRSRWGKEQAEMARAGVGAAEHDEQIVRSFNTSEITFQIAPNTRGALTTVKPYQAGKLSAPCEREDNQNLIRRNESMHAKTYCRFGKDLQDSSLVLHPWHIVTHVSPS